MRLIFNVLRKTSAGHERLQQRIECRHDTQVQRYVDDALLPPTRSHKLLEPNEAPLGEHALLDIEQVAVGSKNRAIREP